MIPFFNRTGLECVGTIRSDQDCCWAGLQALDVALLCKNKKEGGSTGASPVATPMPKSVPL